LTCDGSIPSKEEMAAQIQRKGLVGTMPSAFYTGFGGGGAQKTSQEWIAEHTDAFGNPEGVFWDDIVNDDWYLKVGEALMSKPDDTDKFQKLLSQVFAEQSSGTAWIFAPADLDFNTLDDTKNAW
jgi:hypothetical protein